MGALRFGRPLTLEMIAQGRRLRIALWGSEEESELTLAFQVAHMLFCVSQASVSTETPT